MGFFLVQTVLSKEEIWRLVESLGFQFNYCGASHLHSFAALFHPHFK